MENIKVNTNAIRNRPEIAKKVSGEKYQLIPNKYLENKNDKMVEKNREKITIGIKITIDSKMMTKKIFVLFKPKILKTKFWYIFNFPTTFIALDITKRPINTIRLDIDIPAKNNFLRNV